MKISRRILQIGMASIATVVASGASADSQISLYGQVDAWIGSQKQLGNASAWAVGGGGMSTSYWGIRGNEDLGDGWRTTFILEDFFRPQNGRVGSFEGEPFFARNANIGIGGPYGTIDIGRIVTPFFITTVVFNPFADSYVFSPMVLHTYVGVNSQGLIGGYGWNNAVMYRSPVVRGFNTDLIYALANQTGASNAHKWGGSASYVNGPVAASFAFQSQPFDSSPGDLNAITVGFTRQTAVQGAVSWDLKGVQLYGQYQRIVNEISAANTTENDEQLGVAVPLAAGRVLASYVHSKTSGGSNASRSTIAVGYDYSLSKLTDVYSAILADRATDLSSGMTYGVGIRGHF
jgi:predicted porin